MNPVGIGVLGCGFISRYHLAALASVPEARVVSVADANVDRARSVAERYGVPRFETSLESLIEDAAVEAVLVLTPNHLHLDQAVRAAQAGKHVMVQKPFARSVAEARTMVAVAKEAGVVLAPSFMHRFTVEAREAKRYLEAGAIGQPSAMRVRNGVLSATWAAWFYDRELTGGGAVIDVGVHGIDLVRYLLGEIADVSATLSTAEPTRTMDDGSVITVDAEDTAAITYRTQSDVLVSHEVSWVQRQGAKRFSFELYGDSGTITVRAGEAPLAIASPETGGADSWFVPELPDEPFGFAQHRAFARACRGLDAVDPAPDDGVATLEVVEAVYASAKERRSVHVGG